MKLMTARKDGNFTNLNDKQMKKEDFDRLKAVCEKEGFELINEIDTGNEKSLVLIGVKSKDIWEGVEFAKCILNSESYTIGKTYKINPKFLPSIKTYQDDFGRENGMASSYFKPSNESAYIEQLKAEAFKRFGEINDGDQFVWDGSKSKPFKHPEFYLWDFVYFKDNDHLNYGGITLYVEGKWATRVKESVKVEFIEATSSSNKFEVVFKLPNAMTHMKNYKGGDYGRMLASKLEEYLNKD